LFGNTGDHPGGNLSKENDVADVASAEDTDGDSGDADADAEDGITEGPNRPAEAA
jgi:hypothetical protein